MASILIAEDEHDLNNLLRRHLEDEGHRVLQALDGATGSKSAAGSAARASFPS